ncbi:MAG: hypothetical protein R2861_03530 [Desulfobacterales bacterium]
MNQIPIFILRLFFSAVFAVVISKIFRPDATLFTAGLGIFSLAASYGIEYFRREKNGKSMSDSSSKQIILGTAGHIDHGKTSLIKAIMGMTRTA